MKVLIFLAVWKRPEITEICFMGINRLRKNSRLHIEALAVISEDSMVGLCEKYGIRWTMYKNEPLGEKKNHGLTEAMKLDFDYLIEIGSDDLLKDELLELYEPLMGKYDYFGTKDSVIINSVDGRCRRLKSDTVYGLGRCISKKALQVCHGVDVIAKETIIQRGHSVAAGQKGFFKTEIAEELQKLGRLDIVGQPRYRLWRDEINKGLDNSSGYFLLTQNIAHYEVKVDKPLAVDIKSDQNIWPYSDTLGTAYDLNLVLEGLSQEEQSAIFAMAKRRKKDIEYAHNV